MAAGGSHSEFRCIVTRKLLSVDPDFHRLGIFVFTEFYIF